MEQQIPAKTRTETKTKRRGFVMTGGGAKGLYEAGVINAFHLTGMEFDVITGSSIGAMNSIFFAEYLLNKKILAEKIPDDDPGKPLKLIEQMEESIRRYHHTWLQMPTERIIDDSKDGAIHKLVNQVGDLRINLSDLVTLGWWMTDPKLSELPKTDTGTSFLHTFNQTHHRSRKWKCLQRVGSACHDPYKVSQPERDRPGGRPGLPAQSWS